MITKKEKRKKAATHLEKVKENKKKEKKRSYVQTKEKKKKKIENHHVGNKDKKSWEKRKRKKEVNTSVTKEEKMKSQRTGNLMTNFKGIFESLFYEFLFLIFFTFWKEKLFVRSWEKTFRLNHSFSFIFTISFRVCLFGSEIRRKENFGKKIGRKTFLGCV